MKNTPHKCESPVAAGHVAELSINYLRYPTGQHPRKDIAHLLARLALAGRVVHRGRSGDYTVCNYGYAQHCQDLGELQTFARRLGVAV